MWEHRLGVKRRKLLRVWPRLDSSWSRSMEREGEYLSLIHI